MYITHRERLKDKAKIMFDAGLSSAYIEATLYSQRDSKTSMDDIINIMIEAHVELKQETSGLVIT